jgi:hypothetical protein
MTAEKVLERLVKREGMFTDRESGRRGVAQYVGHFLAEGAQAPQLVLLSYAPTVKVRELTMDRDGNIHLEPVVLDELRVERNSLTHSVESYNGRHVRKGQIFDVLVL